MQLDVRTLVVACALQMGCVAGVFLLYGSLRRTFPGFGHWTGGAFCLAAGLTVSVLRELHPFTLLSVLLANVLLFVGALAQLDGTRRFLGRGGLRLAWYLLAGPLLLLQGSLAVGRDLVQARLLVAAAAAGAVAAAQAWAFLRVSGTKSKLQRYAGAFSLGLVTIAAMQAGLALSGHQSILFAPHWLLRIIYLSFFLLEACLGISFLLLTTERLESELQERGQRLRFAQENAGCGILEWEPRFGTVILTEQLEHLIGYLPGSSPGNYEDFRKRVHPEDLAGMEARLAAAVATREPFDIDFRILPPSGEARWLNCKGAPTSGEEGAPARVLGVMHDVTERRQLQEKISRVAREWQTTFDSTLDAICVLDVEQHIVRTNTAMARLYDSPPAALIGRECWTVVHGTAGPVANCPVERMRATLRREQMDYVMGDRRFEVVADPILDAQGNLVGAVHTMRDVTDRARAVEVMRESRRRLNLASAAGAVALWELEVASGARRWSESAARMLGYPTGELPRGLVHAEDRGRVMEALRRHIEEGAAYDINFRMRKADGTYLWLHSVGESERDAEGRALRVFGASADITALKETEQELRRSNAELDAFASAASHDLQEPLRTIAGFTGLLERRYANQLDDNAREFIRFAQEGVLRMQRQLDGLLAYSRLKTRARPFERVNLEEALKEALHNIAAAVEESGAEIEHQPLPTVLGEGMQLVQLFQNLLGNAVKFHRPGERPRVSVSARLEDAARGTWAVSVRDNGIGIDPKYFERIFQVFQRLHSREEYPGTGIGLALCKRIVEGHGGRIWVESAPGAGATFAFTISQNAIPGGRGGPRRRAGD